MQSLVTVCRRLGSHLDVLEDALAPAADALATGADPGAALDVLLESGAVGVALQATEAIREYERALRLLRGAIVGALVDDQGMTYSAAAERLGLSRTAVSRLHGAHLEGDQRP
ncbi:MAG TPA: hypothetical protein VFC09_08635 [Candidatus Dormibacteraeota bacterium]|nr:hypothetical protein [Candidatus Dormibacteraeota bacterium]